MLARLHQNWNPYTLLVGIQINTTTMKSSSELKLELPYDPVIWLLGIYLKECKTGFNRDTCTPMFITALFTIAKLWKQLRCPATNEWIKKMLYIYTMEFYLAIKSKDMGFECKWMQLEDVMLNELSQAQKEKGCIFSLICKR
jgi:hypothetical protein